MKRAAWLCLFVALSACVALASEISGTAGYVQDGDTFALCNDSGCIGVRVCGIDAPDNGKAGYHEGAIALTSILKGKPIHCVQVGDGTICDGRSKRKNQKRIVAQCFVDGADIAALMVERGYACDCERFSGGYYSKGGQVAACPTGDLAPRGCPPLKK